MSTNQHTGGKWVWSGLQLLASFDEYSEPVLIAEDEPFAPSPEDRALIASAPALLAQHNTNLVDLDLLRRAIAEGDPKAELLLRVDDLIRFSRDAITKATKAQP